VAVELWTGAPPPPAAVVPPKVTPPVSEPVKPAETEAAQPRADIQLGHRPAPHRYEASASRVNTPKKVKPLEVAKPQPKAPARVQPEAVAPGKGKKHAQHYNAAETNELLSDLNSANTTRPATARSNQAGSPNGVPGGVANGSAQARDDGYAVKVRAVIWPLVNVPPGVKADAKVTVVVTLLPTLEVFKVKMIKSSGNSAFDEAVLRAIHEAGTFPALPAGARFVDYRQITLGFKPQ
jgi:colicin import membrane protein